VNGFESYVAAKFIWLAHQFSIDGSRRRFFQSIFFFYAQKEKDSLKESPSKAPIENQPNKFGDYESHSWPVCTDDRPPNKIYYETTKGKKNT